MSDLSVSLLLLGFIALGSLNFAWLLTTDNGGWKGWFDLLCGFLFCFFMTFTLIGSIPMTMGLALTPLVWLDIVRRGVVLLLYGQGKETG